MDLDTQFSALITTTFEQKSSLFGVDSHKEVFKNVPSIWH